MPDLPPVVRALLNPGIYAEKPGKVELIQTQISFVFLAGEYVYKVKKPVRFDFLDFTTLEKRHYYCQRELVLNQRLCPHIYLDVVAITQSGDLFSIGGPGEAVEYAVKMVRLPQDCTLDNLLKHGSVTPEMMARVSQKLAEFHRQAGIISAGFGDLETVRLNVAENVEETRKYVGDTISLETYERLKSHSLAFMEANAGLFEKRVRDGKVKDCHGDLHAAHVCFGDGVCIFDCIEFNDRFRYCDVASEIAFLAMDLDFHGASDLSRHFVDTYMELTGDRELRRLLGFYKCYRAYVRGKVESFKLDDPLIPAEEKGRILGAARRYFELADSYVAS